MQPGVAAGARADPAGAAGVYGAGADMLDDGAEDITDGSAGGGGSATTAVEPPFEALLLEAPRVRPGVLGSLDLWDLAWKKAKLVGEARNMPG